MSEAKVPALRPSLGRKDVKVSREMFDLPQERFAFVVVLALLSLCMIALF